MRTPNSAVLLLFLGLLAGCDSFLGFGRGGEALDTRGATSVTVDDLAVHLFAPDTVVVGEAFEVRDDYLRIGYEQKGVLTYKRIERKEGEQ